MTKAEVIAKIEAAIVEAIAKTNERNEQTMREAGCTQDEIDFMKGWNNGLLRPTVQRAVHILGINLVDGSDRPQ